MLGYCSKDREQPWYKCASQNVSDDELELITQGQALHVQYGAAKHNRVEITPRNLFGRAHCYYMYADQLVEGRTHLTDIMRLSLGSMFSGCVCFVGWTSATSISGPRKD